jgi:hypothetical protein
VKKKLDRLLSEAIESSSASVTPEERSAWHVAEKALELAEIAVSKATELTARRKGWKNAGAE